MALTTVVPHVQHTTTAAQMTGGPPCGCTGIDPQCIHCVWANLGGQWRKRMPWLAARKSASGALVHITCKLCLRAKEFAPRWAKGLQVSHFLAHQQTKKHQRAAADKTAALYLSAPAITVFEKLLKDFRAGRANGGYVQGLGRQAKVRKMKLCLSEAIRKRTRDNLPEAMSLTLHSDASKGRLLVRGQFCGEALQPTHALLGTANVAEDFDCTALGLASAIASILHDLATPFKGAPFVVAGVSPAAVVPPLATDTELLLHACRIVEVLNADSAADEQLAGALLQHGGGAPLERAFPNMVVLSRDKPHGARRCR